MTKRWLVVALALGAACAFAVSVQAGRWWSIEDITIGPFGAKSCFSGDCKISSLEILGGGDRWMRLGMATWAGGLVAMLTLLITAARLAANKLPKLAAKSVLVAIATASVCGTAFVATAPTIEGVTIDRGAWLFLVAIALGIATAVGVLRAKQA